MPQRNVSSSELMVSWTGLSQPVYSAASALRSPGADHDSSDSVSVGTKATMLINRTLATGYSRKLRPDPSQSAGSLRSLAHASRSAGISPRYAMILSLVGRL